MKKKNESMHFINWQHNPPSNLHVMSYEIKYYICRKKMSELVQKFLGQKQKNIIFNFHEIHFGIFSRSKVL